MAARQPLAASDDALAAYLRDISKVPLLSAEQERELAVRAAAGDVAARERLVSANLRFVVRVAKQYQASGVPLADLISEGNIGLLEAVERFDVERGNRFLTYAVWRVRQVIHKAISNKARMIRLPEHRGHQVARIKHARRELQAARGKRCSLDEVAEWLRLDPQDVRALMCVARDAGSLDAPVGDAADGAASLGDLVADSRGERAGEHAASQPEADALQRLLQDDLDRMLDTLPSRHADIIRHRFGLRGRQPMTLPELGRSHRLSSERIRQIEREALLRLRHPARQRIVDAYQYN